MVTKLTDLFEPIDTEKTAAPVAPAAPAAPAVPSGGGVGVANRVTPPVGRLGMSGSGGPGARLSSVAPGTRNLPPPVRGMLDSARHDPTNTGEDVGYGGGYDPYQYGVPSVRSHELGRDRSGLPPVRSHAEPTVGMPGGPGTVTPAGVDAPKPPSTPTRPVPPVDPAPGTGVPPPATDRPLVPSPPTPPPAEPVAEETGDAGEQPPSEAEDTTGGEPNDLLPPGSQAPVTPPPAEATPTPPADGTGIDTSTPPPPGSTPDDVAPGMNPKTGEPLGKIEFEEVNSMISGNTPVDWDRIANSQMSPEEVAGLDKQYTDAMRSRTPLDDDTLKRLAVNRMMRNSMGTGDSPKMKLAEYLANDGRVSMDELREIVAKDPTAVSALNSLESATAKGVPGSDRSIGDSSEAGAGGAEEADAGTLSSWWGGLESDQRMAMMVGIPLALIGVIGSMTEGGVGNMLTAILGIGAMAYGGIPGVRSGLGGMLGEGGMLSGIGDLFGYGGGGGDSSGGYDPSNVDDGSGAGAGTDPAADPLDPAADPADPAADPVAPVSATPGDPGMGNPDYVVVTDEDGQQISVHKDDPRAQDADPFAPYPPVAPVQPGQPGDPPAQPVPPPGDGVDPAQPVPAESPFGDQGSRYDTDGSGKIDDAEIGKLKANPQLLQGALANPASARKMLMSAMRPENTGPEAVALRGKFKNLRGMFKGLKAGTPKWTQALKTVIKWGDLGFKGDNVTKDVHQLVLIANGLPEELFI